MCLCVGGGVHGGNFLVLFCLFACLFWVIVSVGFFVVVAVLCLLRK